MTYSDGFEVRIGDIAKGTPSGRDEPVIGTVFDLPTPQCESYWIAFLRITCPGLPPGFTVRQSEFDPSVFALVERGPSEAELAKRCRC
jgi:hypothetical protein